MKTKFGYKPKHYQLYELVSPTLYKEYHLRANYLWRMLNPFALEGIDIIREFYNTSVIINTYWWGGKYKESGLRDFDTTIGAELSAHKLGCAFDVKVKGVNSLQVQNDIKNNRLPARFYECINCLEDGTNGWTHVARLNYLFDGIVWIPMP